MNGEKRGAGAIRILNSGRDGLDSQQAMAEFDDKLDLSAAATDPIAKKEYKVRTKLRLLGDTIEAGRRAVRWFRSCRQWLLADRKVQSARCPILDAGVQHGSAQDIG